MKYVKVNFHFMMKSDSTLNFRPYDDGLGNCSFNAYDYSKMLITYVNLRLAHNQHMHLLPGNNTPVLSRNYRLVLKGIYFHYDDNAYTYNNLSIGEIAYYSVNPTSEINIFFVYDSSSNYSGGGSANINGDRYVKKRLFGRNIGTMEQLGYGLTLGASSMKLAIVLNYCTPCLPIMVFAAILVMMDVQIPRRKLRLLR